jgi:hypothetical protein
VQRSLICGVVDSPSARFGTKLLAIQANSGFENYPNGEIVIEVQGEYGVDENAAPGSVSHVSIVKYVSPEKDSFMPHVNGLSDVASAISWDAGTNGGRVQHQYLRSNSDGKRNMVLAVFDPADPDTLSDGALLPRLNEFAVDGESLVNTLLELEPGQKPTIHDNY